MELAKRLKSVRAKKEFSVYKLSKLSGVSSTYIHEIEQGKKQPTVEIVFRICSALGITLSEFFSDEPSDMPPELIRITNAARELTPKQRKALQQFLDTLIE